MRWSSSLPLLSLSAFVLLASAGLAACVGDDPAPGMSIQPSEEAGPGSGGSDANAPPQGDAGNPDAPSVDADAGPSRFCQTQLAPTGADFFCSDFDGPNVDEGATRSEVKDGGALKRTQDLFFSPPSSLTPGNAMLVWEKVGATSFTEIELRFRLNVGTLGGAVPPSSGSLEIARLSAPAVATSLSLQYARGRAINGESYNGYFVTGSACPNACAALGDKPIPTPLGLGEWVDVKMTWAVTDNAGNLHVSYNGVQVLNSPVFGATATKVTASLGLTPIGMAPATGLHAFDNVTVTVRRK